MGETKPVSKIVQWWLIAGLVMIFFQVVIGGVTRLTGSGLSITKWEIVTGTFPPLGQVEWNEAFDLYKETPQYKKINEGMSLKDFKFIYFWEYFHRLWARTMGFVFLIPFLIFLFKGMLPRSLIYRLGGVIMLAVLVASLGWVMVASGLINRPLVNAYKLSIHLSVAFLLYAYLLWTYLHASFPNVKIINNIVLKRGWIILITLLCFQIVLGGIMSGMKAGLFYPTWPDMNNELIPNILMNRAEWSFENLVNYDSNPLMAALIQFLHRMVAYLLTFNIFWFFYKSKNQDFNSTFNKNVNLLVIVLIIQVLLGILTVINCVGTIPLTLGVLHQAGALVMLTTVVGVHYQMFRKSY